MIEINRNDEQKKNKRRVSLLENLYELEMIEKFYFILIFGFLLCLIFISLLEEKKNNNKTKQQNKTSSLYSQLYLFSY